MFESLWLMLFELRRLRISNHTLSVRHIKSNTKKLIAIQECMDPHLFQQRSLDEVSRIHLRAR